MCWWAGVYAIHKNNSTPILKFIKTLWYVCERDNGILFNYYNNEVGWWVIIDEDSSAVINDHGSQHIFDIDKYGFKHTH